jgi:hypothetical protein
MIFRHAALAHQAPKGTQRALELLIGLGPTTQRIAAETVAYRQRITALGISQENRPLKSTVQT